MCSISPFANHLKKMESLTCVVDGITDLVEMFYEPDMTLEQCREKIYISNPNFKTDKIFLDFFPHVFGIVSCKPKKVSPLPKIPINSNSSHF
jgi:hypothetical protein